MKLARRLDYQGFAQMGLKQLIPISLGGFALAVAAPAHGQKRCGIYPESVYERALYGARSDCELKGVGEQPLWRGLPAETKEVIRFVFTPGRRIRFFRVVTITERIDGSATVRVSGTWRRTGEPRPVQHFQVSSDELARIKLLGEQSGTWNFDVGTWDEKDMMYLHCQVLEMEKATAGSYNYASVNISCNQPTKLMPLVDEIARIAKLKTTSDGMLYY